MPSGSNDTACSQIYAHASFRFLQEFGFRVSLLFALLWYRDCIFMFFPYVYIYIVYGLKKLASVFDMRNTGFLPDSSLARLDLLGS